MKFLFPLLSFKKHGGIRVLSTLMNELTRNGHEVYLAVPRNNYEDFYKLNPSVKKILLDSTTKGPPGVIKTLLRLFLKTPNVDFVVVSFFPTYYPALLHKIFKKSKIIYFREDAEQYFYPFPFSIFAELSYLLPQDYTPSISKWVLRKTRAKGPILHPPIDRNFIEHPQTKERDFSTIIIFFRKDRRKGPGAALEIMRNSLFNNYQFIVVGEDPEIRAQNIKHLGFLSTRELLKVYDSSGFIILTSKFEGFGLPPLEAMARGCIPFIFTKTGPLEYIKNGKNGFLVSSPHEIALILARLKDDIPKIRQISKNAIDTAKEFTEERFISNFLKMLS